MGIALRLAPALVVATVVLTAAVAPGAVAPGEDWAAIATDDLHYIRAVLRSDHPGPVDVANPSFRDWYARGFDAALSLAARARDYPGYFFAIQYYVNGFQDGHLGALDRDARLPTRWPGFTVGYRDDGFVIIQASPAGPAVGDRLVSCDGRAPEEWAQAIIGDYVGLWSVRGARPGYAPYLLVDEGNPFVRPPHACTFRGSAGVRSYDLEWRAIAFDELTTRIEAARGNFQPPFAVRRFATDGFWISLPSFDANAAETVAALGRVIAEIEANTEAIRSARLLVIDVRGNHGGDSSYGVRIASAIWGARWVAAMTPQPAGIDWRVSDENIRALKSLMTRQQQQFGSASEEARSLAEIVTGMQSAKARGEIWYHETPPQSEKSAAPAPVPARVYLLTDHACFSACLDFADLVRSIPGVVHVGQETSADAVYIDNNALRLPSGNGWIGYSMKVYRGRVRGNNESYVPRLVWPGAMDDTAGLESWIAALGASEDAGR